MKLLLSISLITISFGLYSQNLIPNASFEQKGELYCEDWFAGCCVPLSNGCDTPKTYGVKWIYTEIADSIRGNWCIQLHGSFPLSENIVAYIPATEGTNIYEVKFWMNSINFGGGGGINLKGNPSTEIKWIEDWGQPWTQYSLLDTITCGPNDTLYIVLSASLGDFCICDVQFDQIELTVIDSLPTATDYITNEDSFSVWPNPFYSDLNIQSTTLKFLTFTLYDITGKRVLNQMSNSDQRTIDCSGLPLGIYFYEISSEGQRKKVGRIVKMEEQ